MNSRQRLQGASTDYGPGGASGLEACQEPAHAGVQRCYARQERVAHDSIKPLFETIERGAGVGVVVRKGRSK